MPWIEGVFRPSRASKYHCLSCHRVFAADAVPAPDADGTRICRDCRWDYLRRGRSRNTPGRGGDLPPEPTLDIQ